MFTSAHLGINDKGHLCVDGMDAVALAERFGTPLYVMSEAAVREACALYREVLKRNFGEEALAAYASKALNCKELCRIVMDEGMGLDVVSGGELYTAMSVGFPADRIFFHGNNKTPDELAAAVDYGVGTIVVDNIYELDTLSAIAKANGKEQGILLRIKPGVEAHTHQYIRTGSIDSKFGFALENGEAMVAVKETLQRPFLRLDGVHCHIGSQIFDTEPFCEAARVMLGFMKSVKKTFGAELKKLNLGGGFAIQYTDKDVFSPADVMLNAVADVVKAESAALGLKTPFLVVEPGRSIVGAAGITLYRVGGVKHIEGVRTYVSVDGGMPDNPRYALYGSEYTALIANKADAPADMQVTIAGKCCESGDLIQEHTYIQSCEPGDVMAVLSTGAYNYSMASNYNRIPRPMMVMVKDNEARVIVRRETYEDILRNDI